jgi:hypothetical protein
MVCGLEEEEWQDLDPLSVICDVAPAHARDLPSEPNSGPGSDTARPPALASACLPQERGEPLLVRSVWPAAARRG